MNEFWTMDERMLNDEWKVRSWYGHDNVTETKDPLYYLKSKKKFFQSTICDNQNLKKDLNSAISIKK